MAPVFIGTGQKNSNGVFNKTIPQLNEVDCIAVGVLDNYHEATNSNYWGSDIFRPSSLHAKFRYRWKVGGNIKVSRYFISRDNRLPGIRPGSNVIVPGEKVYLYFKLGPLMAKKGIGAPFQTRLVIRKDGRKVKDFGWHKLNAVNKDRVKRTFRKRWYENIQWYIKPSSRFPGGKYVAVLYYGDYNSGQLIRIKYRFTIKTSAYPGHRGSPKYRGSPRYRKSPLHRGSPGYRKSPMYRGSPRHR
ncbi:hypothetical protein ACFL20_13680 [Spirochaetota bacterium]